jgi:alkyl hydroperoxide reductase subunit F
MYELIIVGGGPAGLAASVYAARKQIKALLISGDIGGQINTTLGIENYLGYQFIEGPELITKFQTQVDQFPIEEKIGEKVARLEKIEGGFEAITESGDRYQGKAVILVTGKKPRKLNVPGEERLTGRGVSYCAICDGPVFAGQKVAVVGGGNSALEAVLDLVKIAEHVSLVSLTPLTGDAVYVDQCAFAENLTILTEHQVEEIKGTDFIEIGLSPNSDAVKDLLKLNQWREVPVTPTNETGVPGLYAAGDVTDVPEKQIIVAAGEGAKAALQAHRYLQRSVK